MNLPYEEGRRLTAMMGELLEKSTFSLDAVEGIKRLRDQAKSLEDENIGIKIKFDNLNIENKGLERRVTAYENAEKVYQDRLKKVEEREVKITELEKRTAVSEAMLGGFKDASQMFLKNTITRETITKNSQRVVPSSSGGAYTQPVTESQTTTKEAE